MSHPPWKVTPMTRQLPAYPTYSDRVVEVDNHTRDRFQLMLLTLAGHFTPWAEGFAPDDGSVGLYLVAGTAGDPADLGVTAIDPGQLLEGDWHEYMHGPANAAYLLTRLLSYADDGLLETTRMPLGDPFWGFATVQNTWTLPHDLLSEWVERGEQRPGSRMVPLRHHPDRIPELFVSMMLHNHRLLMASTCDAKNFHAAYDMDPVGVGLYAQDSEAIEQMIKAVDLAARVYTRDGAPLCPVEAVPPADFVPWKGTPDA